MRSNELERLFQDAPSPEAGFKPPLDVVVIDAPIDYRPWLGALPLGFVDIKVCAVSDAWSGLKLVIGKSERSKR